MKKRIFSLFLALAMVLSLIPLSAMAASSDSGYADTQGHWGEASIERWSDYGIIEGNDGMFYPNTVMNRGQAAKVYANLLGLTEKADLSGYTDVDPSAWYYDYMAMCVAAGVFQGGGDNTLSPDAPMSRQEMFVTFARALGIAPVANSDVEFTDGGQIAGWAEGYINALAERGIVSGGGDGSVAPLTAIDRASVMAMLDKAVNEYVVDNGATVAASGDLVLVVADNVTVTGDVDTLVVAGGDNAVTVTGTVSNAAIVTPDNTLSVSGSARVGNVTIPTAAENASVVVATDATVTTVTSEADNVVISGSGTVGSAVVSGNNTAVNTDGTDLTVAEGTTGVTENSKPVAGGTTVETEPETPTTPEPPVYVPNYYTVTFNYADGTDSTSYTAVENSTVQFPEVKFAEGQKVSWYENGTLLGDTSNVAVTSNRTFTAVVGSDKFTAGNGTETYPYLVANEDQFKAIGDYTYAAYVAAGNNFADMTTSYFTLTSDITYTTVFVEYPYPDDYPDYSIKYGFKNLLKAVIDGAGHTLTPGKGNYAFYNMYYSTLKNLNVVIDDCSIVDTCLYTNTFDNVDVSGSFEVNGNCGAYAIYAYCDSTLTFNSCVADVEMLGTGGSTDYNAVFVGCAYGYGTEENPLTLTLNFNNCVNQGSLVCGRAAMFIGNPYGPGQATSKSDFIMNVTNCANNGEIRATYVNSNYKMNYFHAMPYPAGTVINLDGVQYSDTLDASNATLAGSGTFMNGPDDNTLALTVDENGNFSITAATHEGVAYYKIGIGLYTTYLEGGTNRFYVYSSEITNLEETIDLKLLSFVDQTWLAQNPTAVEGTLDGNKIYTLDDVSYYFLTSVTDTLNGKVSAPTIIYVSAYDEAGNLLCSANMSK